MEQLNTIEQAGMRLFPDQGARVVNVKFFADAPVTATELAADLELAALQIRDRASVVVTDIDSYHPHAA